MEKRVPIMMPISLLDEVDAFRFGARIATRATAIRTLIAAGLGSRETKGPAGISLLKSVTDSDSKASLPCSSAFEVQLDRVALEAAWMKAAEALKAHAPELGPISRNAMMQVVVEAAIPAYLAALTSPPKAGAGAGEPVLLREAAELADEIWASLDEVRRETNLTDSWYSVAEIEGQRILDFAHRIATPEPRGDGVRVTDEMVVEECVGAAMAAIRNAAIAIPVGPFMEERLPSPSALCNIVRDAIRALNPGGRDAR